MGRAKYYHFPLISIQRYTRVKNLSIEHLHRREYENPVTTICIEKNAEVGNLILHDISSENHTQTPFSDIVNYGTVQRLHISDGPKNELLNEGVIENLIT